MRNFSIYIIIGFFLFFLIYQQQKSSDFVVLNVISPTQIIVDINKNGVEEDNEIITLKNIQSFSTKPSDAQSKLSKKIKISQDNALSLGFLSENFAKSTLLDKQVKLKKNNSQIWIKNKNYENLLLSKGLAIEKSKPPSLIFWSNLEKIKRLNLVIFNNKSHKYHKLGCKYGLIAHNSQIVPSNQLPQDAKPCKFCLVRHKTHQKYSNKINKCKIYEDCIPNIKSPSTIYKSNLIKIFLTDMTRVLKPSDTCKTEVCKELVNEINYSQNTIDFAIYGYTKIPAIQNALEEAQERGVKVRFVYDSNDNNQNIYPDTLFLTTVLKNNNHDVSSKIMHDKFFVFDNKAVLTGSANISNTDMSGFNSNVVMLIKSDKIANFYTQEFEQMYNGKFHKSKFKIPNKFDSLDGANLSIYFSPKDKGIKSMIPLVDNAQNYIYIPAFLITHKDLTTSLINASRRGVAVKIILDATNTHPGSHSKMKALRDAGIQVKTEDWAGKLHSKSIIIDDMYTIIGSMNFSRSGEDENDENLIIIKDHNIALFYKTFFQYLWKRIPDKWLKYNARAESYDSIGSCSDGIDNDFDGKIDKADASCTSIKHK